jgi:hypothetical protein
VRYEVEADLSHTMTCNCSHCSKKGFILTFVPEDNFTLESGEDQLTEYRFHTKTIAHLFCRICGTQSFARGTDKEGKPTVMINIRCLDGVDLAALHPTEVDGKSF